MIDKKAKLHLQDKVVLKPQEPFNFLYTFWKPSHFYTGLECRTQHSAWRTFRLDKDLLTGIKASKKDNGTEIEIYANREISDKEKESLTKRIIHSYGFDEKWNDIAVPKKQQSKELMQILNEFKGTRISCPESIFEIAIISLLLQNTTIKRSTSMLANLLDSFGSKVEFDNRELKIFFHPTEIIDVSEGYFKEKCRLGYRAKYLVNFAKFFTENNEEVLRALPEESLTSELQKIKGVGEYTSNVICSHAFRHTDKIGLDSWNKKILGGFLYDNPQIEGQELKSVLIKDFRRNAGFVSTLIIENEYLNKSPDPLL